jgi:hypothetical protein
VLRGAGDNAIVQVTAGATGTGTTAAANALATFSNPANMCVSFNVARGSAFTPGTGFTEVDEQTVNSPTLRIQAQYALNDTTADATLGASVEWGAMALEFRAR